MAKQVEKLTDLKIKSLLKKAEPGLYNDGAGLYLRVGRTGGASWSFKYERAGKVREAGLGPARDIGLADARARAAVMRRKLLDGLDPLAEKAEARAETARTGTTFQDCAESYIKEKSPGWRNPIHRAQWPSSMKSYVFPLIGKRPIADISVADIRAVLDPIWKVKPETASRVRGRLENVIDNAIANELRANTDNPASWRRLRHLYPKKAEIAPVRHHDSLAYADVGALMAKLQGGDSLSAKVLRFTILTAARSGEARGALWSEIDLAKKLWTIPKARMKAKRDHLVPLSAAAVAIINDVAPLKTGDGALLFPGYAKKIVKPLSDVAIAKHVPVGATVHGFRTSFRTWASEHTDAQDAVIERCLAHTIGNAAQQAYDRGELLDKRRALLDAWSAFLVA